MAKKRDAPGPIESRRRLLAEQEKLVAKRRHELKIQLETGGAMAARRDQPPVWRLEDEFHSAPEPTPARRRHLARQRRRDMILFFAFIAVLAIVVIAALLIMHGHAGSTGHA